tara:strand:- start:548 stop:1054 length:507 start_codon:yes stop_codon:yes gene_type:complete
MEKNTIIFDLDGTLAIIDRRREHATKPNGKINWDEFFNPAHIAFDEPNEPVIKLAQMFKEKGFKIVIFSGRNDISFDRTVEWLEWNDVPFDLLVMRPDKFKPKSWPIANGNPATPEMRFMPDEILKKEMLNTFLNIDEVFLVVDDRQKVVDMWRELGLNTWQVAPGNF